MQEVLHVLYAEDDPADADLTRTHFDVHAPDVRLEIVRTGAQCLARLAAQIYDVLLLDHHLPDMDGIDILREVVRQEHGLPVVMVTGVGDEALVVQALRLGASDYVPKQGEYLAHLPAVLRQAVAAHRRAQAQTPDARPRLRRLLYVERHRSDAELTRRHFAEVASHFTVDVVPTAAEALAILKAGHVDVVLADLRLPDLDAIELLREATRFGLRVPFIVVTGRGDEHAAVAALKLGASDYLVKRDNYLTQLPYAIENAMARAQLAETNDRLQKELRERERAEARVRQLNLELQDRIALRTRQLAAAQQELQETAILQLIAENAPLTEICGRLASVLARRCQTMVSLSALPPDGLRAGSTPVFLAGAPHAAWLHTSLSIAAPDGTIQSTVSLDLAGAEFLDVLRTAERLPSQTEFPIRSSVTHRDLGCVTVYQPAPVALEADSTRTIDRCTKLAAIAIHRAHSEDRIRRQALEDFLTGLPNRGLWCDRFEQALATARREGTIVAVFLYDLDRFKDINDGLGHDVGDRVLCYVATQLARTMRPTDTVGRFGGDEFAVVVANLTNVEEAERIAQRGLHAIEEPFQLEDALLTLKASVGIACHPSDGDQPDHLLRRADVAMYRAKRLGGGLAAYEAHRDQDQLESLDLVAELQQAIENDQLLLCYQPKIHLRTGEAIGVECLVRWQHRTRGVMRPIQFIPLAESTGLIKALSVWVIKQAIADSRSWHASGVDVPVAVNLSAPLLYDRELPDIIRREVDAHHVGDGHLEVEITESALMLDPVEAVKTVKRLRARGITFALDDFGTGYSSLAQLKNLEVQTIKIDQSFVRQMVTDARDASIVKAAIELGHSLGLDVVAEGVESGEVREILDDLGCDHAQGFYFGKPMISPEFLTWIRQHDPGPFRRL